MVGCRGAELRGRRGGGGGEKGACGSRLTSAGMDARGAARRASDSAGGARRGVSTVKEWPWPRDGRASRDGPNRRRAADPSPQDGRTAWVGDRVKGSPCLRAN